MSRLVSFFVLIAIIMVIGFLFFRVMAPFLLPLFLAALLVVIIHPLHRRILDRCQGRQRLAAALSTTLVLLIVLLPLLGITFMAIAEGSAMIARQNPNELRDKIGRARDRFELLRMPHAKELRATEGSIDVLLANAEQFSPESAPPDRKRAREPLGAALEIRGHHRTDGTQFDEIHALLIKAQATGDQALTTPEFRHTIRTVASEFHDLKIDLLGGDVKAWIKGVANPTENEMQHAVHSMLINTQGALFSIGGRTTAIIGRLLIGLVIMAVAMYFFLFDGPDMIETVMRLSPLDDRYERELLADFANVSRGRDGDAAVGPGPGAAGRFGLLSGRLP